MLDPQARVIAPIEVTDAMLTSINITEDDYDEYGDATDYAVGDYAISTTTHTVYRALVANGPSSTVVDPDDEAADFADPLVTDPDPRTWQIIGATNRWKLFDEKPTVQATNAASIELTLTPGETVEAVALINLDATEVQIVMTDPIDGEVYNETFETLDSTGIVDAYSYYFEPLEYLTVITALDLPPYTDAEIEITITKTGGTAASGQVVVGRARTLGTTTPDSSGFNGYDFSTVGTDIFGNLETTRRAATRIGKYRIAVTATRLQAIERALNSLRGGAPAVWVGVTDNRLASTTYGYVRSWRVDYVDRAANLAHLTLEIQGIA
jgi:hypothetical protein